MNIEKKINVLVLDDEENILNALKRVFMNEPYGIVTTSDHKKAKELIEREKIKVVMSDQRMPDISGVEFLNSIKRSEPDIIRILFTGYTDIQAAEEAINKGEVFRFINKPWNDDDLRATIRQAINKFDLAEENILMAAHIKKQNEELTSLNAKLKNLYEAQKEFSSTVSHELRTPLSSIKTAIDIVMSGTSGGLSADQEKFLGKAKSNVDRLERLINDILDVAKLEAGKMALHMEFRDLCPVIRDVFEMSKAVAEKKGLFFKTSLPAEAMASFDHDRIVQVLNNLVQNAIKFTEKGGISIDCQSNPGGNHVQVTVTDTGCGIKAEDIPKLFQKFQQLGSAFKTVSGTGLGLAICKEIIGQHGGKIWVESQFGAGSKFCFVVPIQERRVIR